MGNKSTLQKIESPVNWVSTTNNIFTELIFDKYLTSLIANHDG